MWLALLLPVLVLPALVGFSRFEQRVMGALPQAPVRVAGAAPAGRPVAAPRR